MCLARLPRLNRPLNIASHSTALQRRKSSTKLDVTLNSEVDGDGGS